MNTLSSFRALTLVAIVSTGTSRPARADYLYASDNASNYSAWTNGSNGGFGFNAWSFSSVNNAGFFLGDSTAGTGNINAASGNAFGIYAYPSGSSGTAKRTFQEGGLRYSQTFSIQLAVNLRNGDKGINLLSPSGAQVVNFDAGSNTYTYRIGDKQPVTLNFSYQPDSIFTINYKVNVQDSLTDTFTIMRTSATETNSISVDIRTDGASGAVGGFSLYNINTDGASAQNNLYVGNMSIVPEPATYLGGAILSVSGLLLILRRRESVDSSCIVPPALPRA